jgi:hypothetical protein
LAIDKKGGLHYTFCDVDSNFVYHTSSTDGGKSFSPAHLIYKGRDLAPTSTYTHRRENAAPSLTIDQKDNLHLVWGDFQGNQSPLSYYSKSTDHGQTWSVPLPLDSLFGNPVFMPVLSSYGNKITIGANVLDGQKRSSFQILTSLDNGVSFGNPVSQASSSTNLNQHYSNFHGDYTTSFRTACEVYSLWTDCRSSECVLYLARYNECMAASVDNTPIVSHLRLTQVYPNPVHDNLTLVFESKSKNELEINLYSLTGQHLLNTKHFEIEGGRNEISLDFGDLPGGNYILNIKDAHGLFFTRNIMKE